MVDQGPCDGEALPAGLTSGGTQPALSLPSPSPASPGGEEDGKDTLGLKPDAPVILIDAPAIRPHGAGRNLARSAPMAADGNITKDVIYDAVAPDDFESMLELDRYN